MYFKSVKIRILDLILFVLKYNSKQKHVKIENLNGTISCFSNFNLFTLVYKDTELTVIFNMLVGRFFVISI